MTPRRVAILLGAGVVVIAFAIWLSSKRHLDRATMAGDLVLPGLEGARMIACHHPRRHNRMSQA